VTIRPSSLNSASAMCVRLTSNGLDERRSDFWPETLTSRFSSMPAPIMAAFIDSVTCSHVPRP